jgi:hypothetical protein
MVKAVEISRFIIIKNELLNDINCIIMIILSTDIIK